MIEEVDYFQDPPLRSRLLETIDYFKSLKREDGEPLYINVRYDRESGVLLQPNQEIDFIKITTNLKYKLE